MASDTRARNRTIIRFTLIGLFANLALFVGKLIVGLSINSNAIVLDSINSVSDAVSCAFIVISAVLSMRNADKSHPFGYGRLEYVFSLLFSMFIMYIGSKSIVDSVQEIVRNASKPVYNTMSLVIMTLSMLAKIGYGLVARRVGKAIKSSGMIISGTDSIGDSLVALSILVGIILQKLFGVWIESYLCILIALFIIRTGFGMMRECLNRILGMRVDPEFGKSIRTMIINEAGVQNVANLIIHDYGEGVYFGSVDIDVDENLKASDITRISSTIKKKAKAMGLVLTSVGIGAVNISSSAADEIQDKVLQMVSRHKSIVRIHSLSIDLKQKDMSFYVVFDFSKVDHERVIRMLHSELYKCFPDMKIEIFSSINA